MYCRRKQQCLGTVLGEDGTFREGLTCVQRGRPVRAAYCVQEPSQHGHGHAQPSGAHRSDPGPLVLLGVIPAGQRPAVGFLRSFSHEAETAFRHTGPRTVPSDTPGHAPCCQTHCAVRHTGSRTAHRVTHCAIRHARSRTVLSDTPGHALCHLMEGAL